MSTLVCTGHIAPGDSVIATPQSGIPSDAWPDEIASGCPAMGIALWLRCAAVHMRLPEMHGTLRKLSKLVEKPGPGPEDPPSRGEASAERSGHFVAIFTG